LFTQMGHRSRIHSLLGPPEALAHGSRIPQACLDPLADQAPLQFSHGAQDGENHLPSWRRRVELLRQAHKLDAENLERLQGAQRMAHAPCEPVEAPTDYGIEPATVRIG